MKPLIKAFIVLLIYYSLSICFVYAYSGNFDVGAGDSTTRILELSEGDKVSGKIVVVGLESIINFSIINPKQTPIQSYQNVGSRDFKFMTNESGVYEFVFENLFSEESKQVTLHYDVQHYILGYPQEYVLAFFIVGLAVVAVVIFALLSPKP